MPPRPPPPSLSASELAAAARPANVILPAASGSVRLDIDGGAALAALDTPFVIRLAVGMHTQEDMPVSHLTPLNGDAADDGRFTIHLRQPTRYAHFSGESLRHVEVTNVLSTRFVVSWEESYLFEAWLRGPDVPNLHSALPVMITTANASLAGLNALGNAAGRALRGTSVAIFGWAAFSVEASALAAAAVALRLTPACSALSRGSRRSQAAPLRPLAGALLGARGYWTNLTDEDSGWVAKLDFADGVVGEYRPLRERLSTREGRRFSIGPIETFEGPLYARQTTTSELGYIVPPARAMSVPEAEEDEECTSIEYQVLPSYTYREWGSD